MTPAPIRKRRPGGGGVDPLLDGLWTSSLYLIASAHATQESVPGTASLALPDPEKLPILTKHWFRSHELEVCRG